MIDLRHTTAGRTAFGILLVAALLTTAAVGTAGTAAASLDGKGNDVCPCEPLSVVSDPSSIVEVGHLGDRVGTLVLDPGTGWLRGPGTVVLATPSPN